MTDGRMREVTRLALDGSNVFVQSPYHSDSTRLFRQYVEWLRDITRHTRPIWEVKRSRLRVSFDGGGSVAFVSAAHQLDGVRPESVVLWDRGWD